MPRFAWQALSIVALILFAFLTRKPNKFTLTTRSLRDITYHLMTDTDSGSLELIVIDKDSGDCGERKMRDVFLRIFLEHNIQYRLDLSREFSDKFELYGTFYETNKKHKEGYQWHGI